MLLSLFETKYSTIMKSFFEGCQASFVLCKVKGAGKCQKEAKTRVENSCSRQCSGHKNRAIILEVSTKLERNKKANEKMLFQRSLSPMRFMLELQKLLIKYSNKGAHLLLGRFSLLHNLQFIAQKLWLKIGCIFS